MALDFTKIKAALPVVQAYVASHGTETATDQTTLDALAQQFVDAVTPAVTAAPASPDAPAATVSGT